MRPEVVVFHIFAIVNTIVFTFFLAIAADRCSIYAMTESTPGPRLIRNRAIARYALAAAYVTAGVFHLSTPDTFLMIMPEWVPFPRQVILATGVCELAGAAGLTIPRTRRAAGFALALYAVCVFPANIKHAVDGLPPGQVQLGWWYHAPRLALQPVIVWWALFAGEITLWPFRRLRSFKRARR